MSIEGKVVVVTGGGSGIGAATATELRERGAIVCVFDVAPADGDNEAVAVDVSDAAAIEAAVAGLLDTHGSIDALVHCAGVADQSTIPGGSPTAWKRVLDVNALGPMLMARAVLPGMLDRDRGDIVIVASASGRVTYIGEPAYVASKHAAVAFAECLRKETAQSGVRISIIEPGLVDTPMSRSHPFIDTVLQSVTPLQPRDLGNVVAFVLDQPAHCALNEIVVRPTRQEL